jgi:hypothetical protein
MSETGGSEGRGSYDCSAPTFLPYVANQLKVLCDKVMSRMLAPQRKKKED